MVYSWVVSLGAFSLVMTAGQRFHIGIPNSFKFGYNIEYGDNHLCQNKVE